MVNALQAQSLINYIATRDKKLKQLGHWKDEELSEMFQRLIAESRIDNGGRSSCGDKTDMTWRIYTFFEEIIKKAKQNGMNITSENVKQNIKNPTSCGGYWTVTRHTLAKAGSRA